MTCSPTRKDFTPRSRSRRRGRALLLLITLIVVVAGAALFWHFLLGQEQKAEAGPVLHPVKRGPYEFSVLEQGEVESSNNVELRCEVKSRAGSSGPSTTILDVVPEGTQVVPEGEKIDSDQVEVGDVLVRLDSSALEQELVQQQIMVNTSEAIMMKAKNVYEAAMIAKREYLEGTFKQEEQLIQNEIIVAEENLRRAQETAKFSERLAARGYLTPLQLEGDQFAVEKYRNELSAAKTKLDVLRLYTKEKMLKQFESDINSAEVEWHNEQESHALELQKLEEIRQQIDKCVIRAPEPGTVVYANVVSSRGDSEFIVEAGAQVRERQVILRLPDPQHMQVIAQVNESRIMLIKPSMPVSIRIDAVGDEPLKGEVVRVNKYAEPSSWWSSNIKEYKTYIRIIDPPANIRPGLTAEVNIHVDQREDALQIPVQAVLDHGGAFYCVVKDGESWEPRRIRITSTNDRFVAIDESESDPLGAEDMVVMNPRQYIEQIELPALATQPNVQVAASPDEDPSENPLDSSSVAGDEIQGSRQSTESASTETASLEAGDGATAAGGVVATQAGGGE